VRVLSRFLILHPAVDSDFPEFWFWPLKWPTDCGEDMKNRARYLSSFPAADKYFLAKYDLDYLHFQLSSDVETFE
jgi:hypothetical protein